MMELVEWVEIKVVEDLYAEEEERNTHYLEIRFFDEEWEELEKLYIETDGYKQAHWNEKQAKKFAEQYAKENKKVIVKHALYR